MSDADKAGSAQTDSLDDVEAARQEALTRLGVLGSYVSPSMMLLMSTKVSAQLTDSGTIS